MDLLKKEEIHPIGDRVAVERDKASEMHGALHLPQSGKTLPQFGRVIRTCPVEDSDLGGLELGDRVVWAKYSGHVFECEGDVEVLLLGPDDVLAVLRA